VFSVAFCLELPSDIVGRDAKWRDGQTTMFEIVFRDVAVQVDGRHTS
jgi:hypothetical protein